MKERRKKVLALVPLDQTGSCSADGLAAKPRRSIAVRPIFKAGNGTTPNLRSRWRGLFVHSVRTKTRASARQSRNYEESLEDTGTILGSKEIAHSVQTAEKSAPASAPSKSCSAQLDVGSPSR
jgi:hypothetical protein